MTLMGAIAMKDKLGETIVDLVDKEIADSV